MAKFLLWITIRPLTTQNWQKEKRKEHMFNGLEIIICSPYGSGGCEGVWIKWRELGNAFWSVLITQRECSIHSKTTTSLKANPCSLNTYATIKHQNHVSCFICRVIFVAILYTLVITNVHVYNVPYMI